MMRAKRVKLASISGGILDIIGFRCELPDGSFWSFGGKALGIGFHFATNDKGEDMVLELRWPDSGGASLAGDCAWSAFEVHLGAGLSGLVLWDTHGTVGKLTGVTFGVGLAAVPVGWGKVQREDGFD